MDRAPLSSSSDVVDRVVELLLERQSDWHRDPKLFRATKLAIGKLLDHFEQAENLKLSARETQSAKTMADTAVQTVLGTFYDVSPLVPAFLKVWTEMEDKIPDPSGKRAFKEWRDTQYGMEQVRQVLRTEHKS